METEKIEKEAEIVVVDWGHYTVISKCFKDVELWRILELQMKLVSSLILGK